MSFTKHLKLSSALLLGTLTAGTLMSEAAHGADAAKKILDAQHAQRMAAAGGVHAGQINTVTANLTKLKDAMAHPDQVLAMPGAAGSVGAALTAASHDATCVIAGAGGGAVLAIVTDAEKIDAIRAIEHGAQPGDDAHRQAIRTALGLNPADLPGTRAELNHFLRVADERLAPQGVHVNYHEYLKNLSKGNALLANGQPLDALATWLHGNTTTGGGLAAPVDANTRIATILAVEHAPLFLAGGGGAANDDAGKTRIRQALGLPAAPDQHSEFVNVYLEVSR